METVKINHLVDKSRNGDKSAFAKLYDTFINRIYVFIYYKTFHRETAEDLTSKTFIKTLEHIKNFNSSKGSFTSWIYIIARNTIIDHYRTNKSTINIQDIWDIASSEDIELDVQNKLIFEQVHKLIKKLPHTQREIVLLRIWEELSYLEIAEILNKTEASCKMMFSRTIIKLKKHIPEALRSSVSTSISALAFVFLFNIFV